MTTLAFCDAGRQRHQLVRSAVTADGRAAIEYAQALVRRNREDAVPTFADGAWLTLALDDDLIVGDVDMTVTVFCKSCRKPFQLRLRDAVDVLRGGQPPLTLRRVAR